MMAMCGAAAEGEGEVRWLSGKQIHPWPRSKAMVSVRMVGILSAVGCSGWLIKSVPRK